MAAHLPLIMLGAGRMGGAMLSGWACAGGVGPGELSIIDPHPGAEALAWQALGTPLNPPMESLAGGRTLLMAMKPQAWRPMSSYLAARLAPDCMIVSVAAGVSADALAEVFGERPVVRVMPTTGVAIAKGVASIYAAHPQARAVAHALFDPIATTADLDDEALIDAAIGVSGSAPAYLYAFVEALEAAGAAQGLDPAVSAKLARATVSSAAALLEQTGEEPAALRQQVTSPGGTTAAALAVLQAPDGLPTLLDRAVAACVARSREIAAGG